MSATPDPDAISAIVNIIITPVLLIIPLWKMFSRAGFTPLWSLLVFIPFVGLLFCIGLLAFRDWPNASGEEN